MSFSQATANITRSHALAGRRTEQLDLSPLRGSPQFHDHIVHVRFPCLSVVAVIVVEVSLEGEADAFDVEQAVRNLRARYDSARIRDFIPVLVERRAHEELKQGVQLNWSA